MNCSRAKFEEKFKTGVRGGVPNIDIVFYCKDDNDIEKVIAIESKFREPYEKKTKWDTYLKKEALWKGILETQKLAKKLRDIEIGEFKYLEPSQLIKHILGLKREFARENFHLVYLWYNVPCEDGYKHQKEIEKLSDIFQKITLIFPLLHIRK